MAEPVARQGTSAPPDRGLCRPRFVGRDADLVRVATALSGGAALVLVEGEPGIGKSRLVREALAITDGADGEPLVAVCPPFSTPSTLGAVVDAIRQTSPTSETLVTTQLAGALRPLFPEWALSLPPALEPMEDAAASRHRVFRALADLLHSLGVLVVVLEDAQWADEATLEFVLHLVTTRSGIGVVVTFRREDVPTSSLLWRLPTRLPDDASPTRVVLGPLDFAATSLFVSSMVGDEPLSQAFAEFLYRCTDGVPLAVEESVRLFADRSDLSVRDGRWQRRRLDQILVPPSLRDAVLERAARLDVDAQTILGAAAVLAAPAREGVLRIVADLDVAAAQQALTDALRCGLLVEDRRGVVAYRHGLAERAVYDSIPGPERRTMHLRAGRALEAESPLPLSSLARHFGEAGAAVEWATYCERAADVAIDAGDEVSAEALLLDLTTSGVLQPGHLARVSAKIPFVSPDGAARYQDVIRALRGALGGSPLEVQVEGDVRAALGRVLMVLDDYAGSHAELEKAIPHLGHTPYAAARAMMLLAQPVATERSAAAHLEWASRGAAIPGIIDTSQSLDIQMLRMTALLTLGEDEGWDVAQQIPADADDAKDRLVTTRANLNIGELAITWGRYTEAERRLAAALRVAEAHEFARSRQSALASRCRLDWFTGRWEDLRARARAHADDPDIRLVTKSEAMLVAGLCSAAVGEFEDAEHCLRWALRQPLRRGIQPSPVHAAGALTMLLLARGCIDDAVQMSEDPAELVARKGLWVWATEIAAARTAALCAASQVQDAIDFTTRFESALGCLEAPAPQAALALCRAFLAECLGEPRRAAASFAVAAAAWKSLPRPYDALLARERQAHCLLSCGDDQAALALLSESREQFIALGATADAERVEATLRQRGVDLGSVSRSGSRGYGDRLSPREAEVVRLVGAGHTNREIAEVLCRSPRTIESQLRSAKRKLHASNRLEVARLATRAEHGGDPRGVQ